MARKQKKKKIEYVICAGDCETDPFVHKRDPRPFCWEIFDGVHAQQFWGEDSTERMIKWLKIQERPMMIYMHNGGKFDFHYILPYLEKPLLIIGNRVVYARCGIHEFRDSYAILPVGLAAYQKTEIDYSKFEKPVRHKHKKEILSYLHDDCRFLLEMVIPFREMFGDKKTIASAAMSQFQQHHKVEQMDRAIDNIIRPFYNGGRCEVFERGIIDRPIKIYDVNSMYPDRMKNASHPVTSEYKLVKYPARSPDKVSFVTFTGYSKGAMPKREKSGLTFPHAHDTYQCTSHEFFTALDLDLISVDEVFDCFEFDAKPFSLFVDHFYALRLKAKQEGDKLLDLFFKLILNSAYGKFGMDPDMFLEWDITPVGYYPDDADDWEIRTTTNDVTIWSRPSPGFTRYNVATAASVTGAARAKLLRGLAASTNPIYCDTDSVICSEMICDEDSKRLGAWKLEAEGDRIAVAGRKLYAVWKDGAAIKKANKGCKIDADDILEVCNGATIHWDNFAPSYSISSPTKFISRNIRMR